MKQKNNGYIAFVSLLTIAVVALAISISVSLIGISEANSSLSFTQGIETQKIAEACAEEALLQLRNNAGYTGGTLTIENDSCTITVTGSTPTFTITTTGVQSGAPSFTKKLQLTVKRVPNSIIIMNWEEIE